MTSKAEKERQKLIQEKSQQILSQLLKDEDNKYCVDCDAKGPRWASWNLGVFMCIRCAGIHRNLGVHISKVKSVNLDSWTPEQVAHMQRMGNSQARAVYEANLPDNFKRPQSDSQLEAFIRDKYENKKYIAKEWVQPPTPPPAFDIEEERKKDKEKKKAKSIPKPTAGSAVEVQTNPLPRPAATSASSAIPAAISVDKVLSAKKPSADLLGLNISATSKPQSSAILSTNDDDQFDAFVGCEPLVSTESAPTKPNNSTLNSEEDDFFKQKGPEEKKLDKESILKLYGSSSSTPVAGNSLFSLNNNLGGLVPSQPLSVNPPFNANFNSAPQALNPLNSNPLTNQLTNAFASSATNTANGSFANFSQSIPAANNLAYLPQTTAAPPAQANFFQSSTNPFLSPNKNGTTATNVSTNGSAVNQLQSALGSLDLSGNTLGWPTSTGLPNTTMNSASLSNFNNFLNPTPAAATTNPFIQASDSAPALSNLSSSPFGTTNGVSAAASSSSSNAFLNGFGKSLIDATPSNVSSATVTNGATSGLLDVNWSTLSSTTASSTSNNAFATANLWQ